MYEVSFFDFGKFKVLGPYPYSVALKWARNLVKVPGVTFLKMKEVKR